MVLQFLKSGYRKVKEALSKTRSLFGAKLRELLGGTLDEAALERLEQLLYEADLGVETAAAISDKVRQLHKQSPALVGDALLAVVRAEILALVSKLSPELSFAPAGEPTVILIVGVNGNGKTTSVAKLAKRLHDEKKKVIVGAADTFRAAAVEQLTLWAEHIGIEIVKGTAKSDPAAVVFDAVSAAKARSADVVLIDTAGRLHTKTNLMQELEKIRRSCKKNIESSPHETLLVLDATTGQNAIDQALTFHRFTPITGIILTKLDGSAKGGIAIAIQQKLQVPIKFVGVGEGVEDLMPFDAESFVTALLDS